jgi:hypothetical protein
VVQVTPSSNGKKENIMIAQPNKTYAQILNNQCHWIFTAADLPEWNNDHCPAVDVTGDIPNIGDIWNGSSFDPAPIITIEPVVEFDPVAKLAAFMAANPDVAKLLNGG